MTSLGAEDGGKRRAFGAFAAMIGVLLLAGLVRRLARLGFGLWIDEAGTLWCVEGDLGQCIARTLEVQGQSPLAYVLSWAAVNLLGESEVALRLPSLLASVTAALLLVPVGRLAASPKAGWIAAALLASSTGAVLHGAEARPYSLAAAFTSLLLLGFLRATAGAPGGRPLFVLAGLGLFYTHYLLVLPAVGLAAAWALRSDLRARWPAPSFALDVGVQVVAAVPGLVDLASSVRPTWVWQYADPGAAVLIVAPAALVTFAAWRLEARGGVPSSAPESGPWPVSAAWSLALAATAPVAIALLLAPLGVSILIPRYLSNVAVPAAALAGVSVWRAAVLGHRRRAALLGVTYLLLTGPFKIGAPLAQGDEGWREAVARLEDDQTAPPAPVLYRSGFVEDNERPAGRTVPEFTLAPLRPPGGRRPAWPIVPLTCTWDLPGRARYLEARVAPVLATAPRVYVISYNTLGYVADLDAWIESRFPGRFERRVLVDGRAGVKVFRYDQRR